MARFKSISVCILTSSESGGKKEFFFDVYKLFFDLLFVFGSVFAFRPVWMGPKAVDSTLEYFKK